MTCSCKMYVLYVWQSVHGQVRTAPDTVGSLDHDGRIIVPGPAQTYWIYSLV